MLSVVLDRVHWHLRRGTPGRGSPLESDSESLVQVPPRLQVTCGIMMRPLLSPAGPPACGSFMSQVTLSCSPSLSSRWPITGHGVEPEQASDSDVCYNPKGPSLKFGSGSSWPWMSAGRVTQRHPTWRLGLGLGGLTGRRAAVTQLGPVLLVRPP